VTTFPIRLVAVCAWERAIASNLQFPSDLIQVNGSIDVHTFLEEHSVHAYRLGFGGDVVLRSDMISSALNDTLLLFIPKFLYVQY
jgi:hypothetical protein